MRIVILGPQASGKGTQADLLSERFGIPHVSTGDILRQNIKDMTGLGKTALGYINEGKLVPDEVINNVVGDRLAMRDCEAGFILDGFPRNIEQAEFLDKAAELDRVIEITVSDKEAIRRISGRRTCQKCHAVYSIYQDSEEAISGVCKKCGGNLVIRDDDREEAVKKRLEIYHEETEPLIDFYDRKGLMMKIDGERPIDVIFEEISKKLK